MRLFAAVLPPAPFLAELGRAVDPLLALPGAGDLRWTGRAGWHLTLAFYGEVPDDSLPELTERLTRAAHRTAPFPLALRGAGLFGGRSGGRSLWAGVAGDTRAMRLLADRAEAAARRAGLPTEEHHRFRPHLSLARSRTAPVDLGPYVAGLDGFTGSEWTVGELALVRSNLPRSGVPGEQPRYETVAAPPLEGAG
ncbi:RNA 2',3'-cyclic phosphodiesterase [Streptomyces sp. NPDC091292]|uniref:RNA 2',3'-cyclic phosphodiesterase n=1 Tax=Streptomyces sp. NPDC091292 TaxID=3365991 RepID=UPI00381714C6